MLRLGFGECRSLLLLVASLCNKSDDFTNLVFVTSSLLVPMKPPLYSRNMKNSVSCVAIVHLKMSCNYRKIPKISPSKYKPPKFVTQKTFR